MAWMEEAFGKRVGAANDAGKRCGCCGCRVGETLIPVLEF